MFGSAPRDTSAPNLQLSEDLRAKFLEVRFETDAEAEPSLDITCVLFKLLADRPLEAEISLELSPWNHLRREEEIVQTRRFALNLSDT